MKQTIGLIDLRKKKLNYLDIYIPSIINNLFMFLNIIIDNFKKFLNKSIGHKRNMTNQVSDFSNKNAFLDIQDTIIRHLIVDNASISSSSSDPKELKRVENLRKDIKVLRQYL